MDTSNEKFIEMMVKAAEVNIREGIKDKEEGTPVVYKADGNDHEQAKEMFNRMIDDGLLKEFEVSTEMGTVPESDEMIEFIVLSAKVA